MNNMSDIIRVWTVNWSSLLHLMITCQSRSDAEL